MWIYKNSELDSCAVSQFRVCTLKTERPLSEGSILRGPSLEGRTKPHLPSNHPGRFSLRRAGQPQKLRVYRLKLAIRSPSNDVVQYLNK